MNANKTSRSGASAVVPRERLIHLVRQVLGPQAASRPLPIDARLAELGISSIMMVSLMLAIEAEFNLTIPQSEITPESWASIASIECMLERLGPADRH